MNAIGTILSVILLLVGLRLSVGGMISHAGLWLFVFSSFLLLPWLWDKDKGPLAIIAPKGWVRFAIVLGMGVMTAASFLPGHGSVI